MHRSTKFLFAASICLVVTQYSFSAGASVASIALKSPPPKKLLLGKWQCNNTLHVSSGSGRFSMEISDIATYFPGGESTSAGSLKV